MASEYDFPTGNTIYTRMMTTTKRIGKTTCSLSSTMATTSPSLIQRDTDLIPGAPIHWSLVDSSVHWGIYCENEKEIVKNYSDSLEWSSRSFYFSYKKCYQILILQFLVNFRYHLDNCIRNGDRGEY
ncbi:MAG: hypothetical protein ACFFB2_17285 [Promethearchaeota archaeon]